MNKILKWFLIFLGGLIGLAILLILLGSFYPTFKITQGLSPTSEYVTPLPTFNANPETEIVDNTNVDLPESSTGTENIEDTTFSILPNVNDYTWNVFATGFDSPIYLTHANDNSGRIFIIEKSGVIQMMENDFKYPTPFLDIRDRVGSDGFEQGLLGIAFHPNYLNNGFFFLNYTDQRGNTIVARYQVSADADVADPGTESRILTVIQPYPNHNGGHLAFGPDGYLYIGLGDGGLHGDPEEHGQNNSELLGKMLRLDIDHGKPYAIPADNYYAIQPLALPEIWATGLRNPWRYSFDSKTGDLYIADVGQDIWEEINFVPANSAAGLNFGWDYFEGNHEYENTPPDNLTFVFPVTEYNHTDGNCSVAGGFVYRGEALPEWHGIYIYSDFCTGAIWGLWQSSDGIWENQKLYNFGTLMTSFGEDQDGEIYFLTMDGVIFRFEKQE